MFLRLLLASIVALSCAARAAADEAPIERAAELLLKTTVTLRIAAKGEEKPAGVTVCSGTSLGDGLVLTFLRPARASAAGESTYRVTLPDGEQAAAQPVVVDRHAGLLLLQIESRELPGLKLAGELPKIGGAVLAASASGIEKPLVSMGVLSGVDRTISGADLPAMFQCDISTTETASGAAVINAAGELLGIIAATEAPGERFGWTYALPTCHVRRVLDARQPGKLVVLMRRRPSIGLQLGPGPGEGAVQVERVLPDGPAAAAGIRPGEIVYEADGRKVRSAYQVVGVILKRQPGDRIALVVGDAKTRRQVEVTLAGEPTAVAESAAKIAEQKLQVGPQVNLRLAGPNRLEVRNGQAVAELSVAGPNSPQRSPGDEVELLKAQLQAYERVIQALQEERRKLSEEVERMRKNDE